MPHSITAEFSLNTPLFSSGADPNSPELRVSEIKAALRFWWRAMNYGLYAKDPARFVDVESQLFGSASASYGQGVLVALVNVMNLSEKGPTGEVYQEFVGRPGARYLAYGLMAFAYSGRTTPPTQEAQLQRGCLKPGGTFKIRLNWKSEVTRSRVHKTATLCDADFEAQLIQALKTFGTFGGLGSRSRRGYGSVTLQTLENEDVTPWIVANDAAAMKATAENLLIDQRKSPHHVPADIKYSAFTCLSRCTVFSLDTEPAPTPYQLLNAMGSAFVRYRAWGRYGQILNQEPSNKIFKADHDWFRGPADKEFTHPHRIVFGLPLPYSDNLVWGGRETRRASPLFFHIHKATPNLYLGLMFDLRSQFLAPSACGGRATIADPRTNLPVTITPDWSMLDELHDGAIPTRRSKALRPISLIDGITCTRIF